MLAGHQSPERVTGQSYQEYVAQNIFDPAGVRSTTYCDDFTLTRGLSHGYRRLGDVHVLANENGMAYNTDLRYCSTVEDLYRTWLAGRERNLLKPETRQMMRTAEGPAVHMSPQDPEMYYGLALTLNQEGDHRSIGQHGSLLGYSGSMYDFPRRSADHRGADQYRGAERVCNFESRGEGRTRSPGTSHASSIHAGTGDRTAGFDGRNPAIERDLPADRRHAAVEPARFVCAVPAHLPRVQRKWASDDPAAGSGRGAAAEAGGRQLQDALGGAYQDYVRDGKRA